MFELGDKLKLHTITIHLAVVYLDWLLHISPRRTKKDLVALVTLLVAAKFDEIDDNLPFIKHFQGLTANAYSYD